MRVKTRFTQERMEGTWLDRSWVGLFLCLAATVGFFLVRRLGDSPGLLATGFMGGWVLSDLVSGTVHWAGDTWGNAEFPVLGPKLIRPFREHHYDPKSITQHDFFDVNGTNCLLCIPQLIACLALGPASAGTARLFAITVLWSLGFWTFITNQAHKWAHQDDNPAWVRALQRLWILLPPAEHAKHHQLPFSKYYCITTGWLNPVLTRLDVFGRLERGIHAATGWVPRQEEDTCRPKGYEPDSPCPTA